MQLCGLMWDSTTPGVIPGGALLRALYVNGRYAVRPDYGRGRVYIDVTGGAAGQAGILDVETGDATPEHAGPWLTERKALDEGTLYCSRGALGAVLAGTGNLPFCLWLATLDGTIAVPALPSRVTLVAVQAFGAAMTGINADLSVVLDQNWWERRALPPR